MDTFEKLTILADAAKYDVACTSSGVDRAAQKGALGSAVACGICHSFTPDGRCTSLLKVLQTNVCSYDCKYCVNRRSNDTPRATFSARELADLVYSFYRRNYIEGLFLSSGVAGSPDSASVLMAETLSLLRNEYNFRGYIHVKAIPGASPDIIKSLGLLADRMSVNVEMPSSESLADFAPEKSKQDIFRPMRQIESGIAESKHELIRFQSAPKFAPAGQSTQMVIGASPDTDYKIIRLSQALYKSYKLRRVFYSAYIPMGDDSRLPAKDTKPPLLREHRLYEADWLMRFYGFDAEEILDEEHPMLNPYLDPKCNWAVNHLDRFPVEVNKAPKEMLLRVPGMGLKSVERVLDARRLGSLDFDNLKRIGVVLKRAQFFITCKGKMCASASTPESVLISLLSQKNAKAFQISKAEQISMFPEPELTRQEIADCIAGRL